MFGYKVCYDIWRDLESKHIYHKNDIFPYDYKFPFDNSEISEKRISELSSNENKIGKILIKARTLNDLDINELKEYATYLKIENVDTLNEKDLLKFIKKQEKKSDKNSNQDSSNKENQKNTSDNPSENSLDDEKQENTLADSNQDSSDEITSLNNDEK